MSATLKIRPRAWTGRFTCDNSVGPTDGMIEIPTGWVHGSEYPFVWQPNTYASKGFLPTKSTQKAVARQGF
jgi:hypothetical protein